jgi:hypothetical protein
MNQSKTYVPHSVLNNKNHRFIQHNKYYILTQKVSNNININISKWFHHSIYPAQTCMRLLLTLQSHTLVK